MMKKIQMNTTETMDETFEWFIIATKIRHIYGGAAVKPFVPRNGSNFRVGLKAANKKKRSRLPAKTPCRRAQQKTKLQF